MKLVLAGIQGADRAILPDLKIFEFVVLGCRLSFSGREQ
jgi:hypothetical protein